jgi:hypothetical protein
MVFKALKNMLGGGADTTRLPPPPPPTGPLGLGLGLAAQIDLLRFRASKASLAMPPMSETLVISGYGQIDLGDGSVLHRFYDDDNIMLQVLCERGTGPESVREVMLFQPWDSVVPQTSREWAEWDGQGGKIGLSTFSADGFTFQRFWGDPADAWIEPVQFTEMVQTEEGLRTIHQKVVSYRRPITGTDDFETLLLAVERDTGTGSGDRGSVTFMIGYDLHAVEVSAV